MGYLALAPAKNRKRMGSWLSPGHDGSALVGVLGLAPAMKLLGSRLSPGHTECTLVGYLA